MGETKFFRWNSGKNSRDAEMEKEDFRRGGVSGRRETGESFSPFGAYYVETGVNSCYIRKTDTEIK